MPSLDITLFGGLEVRRNGALVESLSAPGLRSLLAFLLLRRGGLYARDVLCGELWGDHPDASARKALRNGLWRLRVALDPGGSDAGPVLVVDGDGVGVSPDAVRVDAWEFDAATVPFPSGESGRLDSDEARRLGRAADLYRGDLLDGFYHDWCLVPRERTRLAFLGVLERLVDHHRALGEYGRAVARGQTLLLHDPMREHMHRALMALHWARGDRPSALRQFQACRRVLREELDIEPMEETRALYDALRAGAPPPVRPRSGAPRRRSRHAVPEAVRSALGDLYAATERLEGLYGDAEDGSGD